MANKTKTQIKPEILEQLQKLNHEKVGRMADALSLEPQTLRNHHFKNNTKALLQMPYLVQIGIVLDKENYTDLVEEVSI